MRVLMTLMHVHPMIPLARALAGAGHEVRFVGGAEDCAAVERLGFQAVLAGGLKHRGMPQVIAEALGTAPTDLVGRVGAPTLDMLERVFLGV